MATKEKKTAKHPGGRPTSYKPEYCQMLIQHMREGGSIESFGSLVGHSKQSIYTWFEKYPEFMDARKIAEPLLHAFYENLGKMIATGQLRRVKSEEPMLDDNGNPIIDPKTGQVLMKRKYEPTQGNSTAFIWMTKNLLKWRDRSDIEISGKEGGPIPIQMTPEQRRARIDELIKKAKE